MANESSDVVGIIYAKETADNVYGKVLQQASIGSSQLLSLAEQCDDYIMFLLNNNEVVVSDKKRKVLFPQALELSGDTVFHYFSTDKLLELLNIGDAEITIVELRQEVLSITNGNFTLENSKPCPPYCQ